MRAAPCFFARACTCRHVTSKQHFRSKIFAPRSWWSCSATASGSPAARAGGRGWGRGCRLPLARPRAASQRQRRHAPSRRGDPRVCSGSLRASNRSHRRATNPTRRGSSLAAGPGPCLAGPWSSRWVAEEPQLGSWPWLAKGRVSSRRRLVAVLGIGFLG
jgi:hypothetical protein